MNYIMPNATKKDKELIKTIKDTSKAFLDLKGYQPQAYRKAAYLNAGKLYITNSQMLVEFTMPFETPTDGIFVLPVMVGSELQLVEQTQLEGYEYPDIDPLFQAEHTWLDFDLGLFSLSVCYCQVIHAMSTLDTVGVLDISYFKLLPAQHFVVKCDAQMQSAVSITCPIVFESENYRAVIMPMKYN